MAAAAVVPAGWMARDAGPGVVDPLEVAGDDPVAAAYFHLRLLYDHIAQ